MLKAAFAGFRHGHVYQVWNRFHDDPEIEIVGACDEDEAVRADIASRGIKVTHTSNSEMIKETGADIVVITDSYGKRGQIAIEALKNGCHVIADKPLCTTLDELDEIEKLSKEKNLSVGILLTLRECGCAVGIRALLASGRAGEVRAAAFTGQHPLMYGQRPSWYFEKGMHGGTINDLAIHGIDLITFMTGLRFKKVTGARAWNSYAKEVPYFNDCVQFMYELENGCGVIADTSYAAPTNCGCRLPQYWRFTIWTDNGVIETNYAECSKFTYIASDSSGPEVVNCEGMGLDIIGMFLDEVKGNPQVPGTREALESARATLLIQKAADDANK